MSVLGDYPPNVWQHRIGDMPDLQTIRVAMYVDVAVVDAEINANTPEGIRSMLNTRLSDGVRSLVGRLEHNPRWPEQALSIPTPASETRNETA